MALGDLVEVQMAADAFNGLVPLIWVHQIQLVDPDEHSGSNQSVLVENRLQLFAAIVESVGGTGVYHPDHEVRLLKVVSPERSQSLLAANVPDVELVLAPCHRADVEAQRRRHLVHVLVENLLDYRRLARVVQTTVLVLFPLTPRHVASSHSQHEHTDLLILELLFLDDRE